MAHEMVAAAIPLAVRGPLALDVQVSWGHLGWGHLDRTCRREDKRKGVGKGGDTCKGGTPSS